MYKSVAAVLGLVSILATAAPSQAAAVAQVGFDPAAVQQVQYHHYYHRHWHHWHHWHRAPVVVINPR